MNTAHSLKSLTELESQIAMRISEFEAKRRNNQKKNKFFSVFQIVSTSITTLLIAVNAEFHALPLTILALFVSTCAGIAGQLLNKFMYQERMAMNIATICSLYELRHVITMAKKMEEDDATNRITLKDVVKYQEQYQNILNTANGQWQNYIQNCKSAEK